MKKFINPIMIIPLVLIGILFLNGYHFYDVWHGWDRSELAVRVLLSMLGFNITFSIVALGYFFYRLFR